MLNISTYDIARAWDSAPDDVNRWLGGYMMPKLAYSRLLPEEREQVIHEVHQELKKEGLRISGKDDPAVWEKGWGEVRDRVQNEGFSLETLQPQYFADQRILRWDGDFIQSHSPNFVFEMDQVLRHVLYGRFLSDSRSIIEIGCGTGLNILRLSDLFPNVPLHGCDWAQAAVDILELAATTTKRNITTSRFNMLTGEGAASLPIDPTSTVLTVHALEQVGATTDPVLNLMTSRKPRQVIHLEPILEFYDTGQPFDRFAADYHLKRNYLQGYWPRLKSLADQGKADILYHRRLGFGSHFHEAYSVIVWRPL